MNVNALIIEEPACAKKGREKMGRGGRTENGGLRG